MHCAEPPDVPFVLRAGDVSCSFGVHRVPLRVPHCDVPVSFVGQAHDVPCEFVPLHEHEHGTWYGIRCGLQDVRCAPLLERLVAWDERAAQQVAALDGPMAQGPYVALVSRDADGRPSITAALGFRTQVGGSCGGGRVTYLGPFDVAPCDPFRADVRFKITGLARDDTFTTGPLCSALSVVMRPQTAPRATERSDGSPDAARS